MALFPYYIREPCPIQLISGGEIKILKRWRIMVRRAGPKAYSLLNSYIGCIENKGEKMLDGKFQRGFTIEKLKNTAEPKVHHDSGGFYINTLSENVKVYFDDYYLFLERVYEKCEKEIAELEDKLTNTSTECAETTSYYRARMIIIDLTLKSAKNFYVDGSNFGVIMTPWCFGTVVLEKIEIYRERLARGEVNDQNIPEYPYYVIKYIDEIYKKALLDLFDFPEEAFKMRWQYSELLKRYSKVLTNITQSLNSVLMVVKNYGA
jgi:hypothetical protein